MIKIVKHKNRHKKRQYGHDSKDAWDNMVKYNKTDLICFISPAFAYGDHNYLEY